MKILGKTIIVTGAANGIGREITLQLLNKGAHVIALDISMKALVELVDAAADKGSNLTTYAAWCKKTEINLNIMKSFITLIVLFH